MKDLEVDINIFATDQSPKTSAKNLDDKRVIKMVVETAQMLSTAVIMSAPEGVFSVTDSIVTVGNKQKNKKNYFFKNQRVYSPCYHNHPATKWARETNGNYCWLLLHFLHLCSEYQLITGKKHASESLIDYLCEGNDYITAGEQKPFANCANNSSIEDCDFRKVEPVTDAYKMYLNKRFIFDKRPVTFTNRDKPSWVSI
jgi:hypothetical protein